MNPVAFFYVAPFINPARPEMPFFYESLAPMLEVEGRRVVLRSKGLNFFS